MKSFYRISVLAGCLAAVILSGCSDQKSSAPAAGPQTAQVTGANVRILKWGPQLTRAGKGFAIQSSGNSAIWFEQRGIGNAEMVEVWFGDKKLGGMAIVPDAGGSAEVPPALIGSPGRFPVYLMIKPEGKRIDLGEFEVTAN
jgi:hypothetical protein